MEFIMNNRKWYLLAIILLLFTSVFLTRKFKKNYAPPIELAAISIKDLNGNIVDLSKLSGKPLIINFWGTWCGPCREELPGFEKVKEAYGDRVNFVMVSDEPLDKIIKFKEANKYTFSFFQLQKTFHDLGITSVPFTYFYDADGGLIYKKKVELSEDELEGLVKTMVD